MRPLPIRRVQATGIANVAAPSGVHPGGRENVDRWVDMQVALAPNGHRAHASGDRVAGVDDIDGVLDPVSAGMGDKLATEQKLVFGRFAKGVCGAVEPGESRPRVHGVAEPLRTVRGEPSHRPEQIDRIRTVKRSLEHGVSLTRTHLPRLPTPPNTLLHRRVRNKAHHRPAPYNQGCHRLDALPLLDTSSALLDRSAPSGRRTLSRCAALQADIRSVRQRPARRKIAAQPMKTAIAVVALMGTACADVGGGWQ